MQIKMNSLRTVALSGALVLMAAPALAESGEVNVYTTREPGLIQPLLDTFSKETGIKTNVVFMESGLAERVEAEGENSPADLLSVVDYGNLIDFVGRGADATGQVRRSRCRGARRICAIPTATGTRCRCAHVSSMSRRIA